jgi:O-antigen/teichoic acid export membrane protein
MKGQGSVLVSAIGFSFLTKSVNLLLSFITIPIAINHLGAERYGLWMLALASFGIMSNLDLGLAPAIKNKMAEAFAKSDSDGFRYLKGCALFLALVYCGIALVAAGVGMFVDWQRIFNSSSAIARGEVEALAIVLLLGVTSCSSLMFVEAVCAAQLQLTLIRLVQLSSTLLGFSLFAVMLYSGQSLPWVAAGTHVACVLGGIFLVVKITHGNLFSWRITRNDVRTIVKQLLPQSLPFAGIQLTNAAFLALPSLIIAHTMTQTDVATFAVGYKFVTVPLFMVTEIGIVFWPISTVAWTRGESTWLLQQLRRLLLGTVLLMIVFSLVSFFFGERIITAWTAGGVHVRTELLLALTLWLTVQSVVIIFHSFLRSVSDFTFELLVNLVALVVFCIAALLLVQEFGLTGVGIALLISSLIASLVPMGFRVRSKLAHMRGATLNENMNAAREAPTL